MYNNSDLYKMSSCIKMLSAYAVENAKSGHPGTAIGASDIITALFANHLQITSKNPNWISRDRFVLSAGHSCIMLYSALHLLGYEKFDINSLQNLRRLNFTTSGHPEVEVEGIEVSTGPLGEGVAMAVGLAIAERNLNTKYENISNYTYAFVGDGCLMEGVSYEALSLAGHLKLNKLIVIYDNNDITIDGDLLVANSENMVKRMESCNFNVIAINGHDFDEINQAFTMAKKSDKPVFIFAKTKIAHLAGSKEGKESSHGSPIGLADIEILKKNLNWSNEAFDIPINYQDLWNNVKNNNYKKYLDWETKSKLPDLKFYFKNALDDLDLLAKDFIAKDVPIATRTTSGLVLEVLQKHFSNIIGGSCDLSQSNNTINKNSKVITSNTYDGNYIHYGVREHAMGAIMNGLSCYGGNIIPYGGTFLVFSDFLKPALRLSALMEKQMIYVFTHDSISVGGDGPTHQPIEHIHTLALIPNVEIFRPCDGIETIEAYQLALNDNTKKPTAMILSRANIPTLRKKWDKNDNKLKYGAYILETFGSNPKLNLISNGSELYLTKGVAKLLFDNYNISSNVISMPSITRFKNISNDIKQEILQNINFNILIEASNITGYAEHLNGKTIYKGLTTFGKSGDANEVLDNFGFTIPKLLEFVVNKLKENGIL
jgi:transketolase